MPPIGSVVCDVMSTKANTETVAAPGAVIRVEGRVLKLGPGVDLTAGVLYEYMNFLNSGGVKGTNTVKGTIGVVFGHKQ